MGVYIAIDLKSFYASVECIERKLDPLNTNLVVADRSRTEKTICLAVSPSLKAYGIPGRLRLFDVEEKKREVNIKRKIDINNRAFTGKSFLANELEKNSALALDYITATPRMALYLEYSARIYNIYLKYVAPEDIHVYSIDEVFMDVTKYLKTYGNTPSELAMTMIKDVFSSTGITATAGIGSNLYLAKISMDIEAKHKLPDENGVRIASLDEQSYRKLLWNHTPLTDFWRIGRGYAKKLEDVGLYTMGDIARCSLGKPQEFYNEDLLYKLFGINAELLIDHAWGWEPCTMEDIKAYKPIAKSISQGQVLQKAYSFEKAKLIVREMTDVLVLDLVEKKLCTDQIVLTIGYDIENFLNEKIKSKYQGKIKEDTYGRKMPEHAHSLVNLEKHTSSTKTIIDAVMGLFERIVDKDLLVRRINITANHTVLEEEQKRKTKIEELDLFASGEEKQEEQINRELQEKEKQRQLAILRIKKKFGKNAVLKGMDLQEGAMTIMRNKQIGGHKA